MDPKDTVINVTSQTATSNSVESESAPALAEGTPQAFGGTAGTLEVQDPRTLPSANLDPIRKMIRNGSNHSSILNRNTLFNISDYEKIMLGRQSEKLQKLSGEATQQLKFYSDSKRFFNLSISEIIRQTSLSIVVIFMELVHFFSPEAKAKRANFSWKNTISQFGIIFTMDNRIMYLGVFLILLSILFMVIFLSS